MTEHAPPAKTDLMHRLTSIVRRRKTKASSCRGGGAATLEDNEQLSRLEMARVTAGRGAALKSGWLRRHLSIFSQLYVLRDDGRLYRYGNEADAGKQARHNAACDLKVLCNRGGTVAGGYCRTRFSSTTGAGVSRL